MKLAGRHVRHSEAACVWDELDIVLRDCDAYVVACHVRCAHDGRREVAAAIAQAAVDASFVNEFTAWFDVGADLAENELLWPKRVCSDGGEGSVRIPFEHGVQSSTPTGATVDTKFFYDFGCPYGSQPEACPPREGLKEYQETMDELEQPSGPAFANCFDENVPDFECCHATHEFRIHGGPGKVGNLGFDDLDYCALTEAGTDPDLPNEYSYQSNPDVTGGGTAGSNTVIVRPFVDTEYHWQGGIMFNMTFVRCMAICDSDGNGDFYTWQATTSNLNYRGVTPTTCGGFTYNRELAYCIFYEEGADTDPPSGSATSVTTTAATASSVFTKITNQAYRWPEVTNTLGDCPLHYTSYHHTTTGCKAFCRAAFQRDGDDNTCMPAKPECANWLDAVHFPSEEYTTVDAECICGAKLEEYQESGKYVNTGFDHRGTVLQGTRKRALHEDDGVDDDQWEWPDAIPQGIDQFHGAHFDVGDTCIAEIMSFRTDLLNNSQCDNYLDLGAPPITEWGPKNQNGEVPCAEDGSTDDQCCVAPRGAAQASRLWTQQGDMSTMSVAQSFTKSNIVGTAVHTSQVAAVGNFDDDDYPDIVIGNRLYVNRQWVKHADLNFRKPPSELLVDFDPATSLTLDECKARCLA